MTAQKKREMLRSHPDTQTLTIAGADYSWNFGIYALKLAKKAGIDVDAVFADFGEGSGFGGMMDGIGDIVAIGLMPFEDDAQDIADLMSVSDLQRVAPVMESIMEGFAGEASGDEPGKPAAESS